MSTPISAPFKAVRSAATKTQWLLPLLFGSTIFTSACLLFLLQPLISKMILPWFGGSAAVWITAMLYFQTALLLGYLYAHYLTRLLAPKLQAILHMVLLGASLLLLPISPAAHWLPAPGSDPTLEVFILLGSCIGLPYVLLSATSPLIQNWFALRSQGALPYRYFALSNAGSLLALFAFPLVVEPRLTSHQQSILWSTGFGGFAVLCLLSSLLHVQNVPSLESSPALAKRAEWGSVALWISLAACASALLLVVTNLLTQNIAPMPLLWVVPLGIYLLTFILCFDSDIWYRRWLFLVAALPALGMIAATTEVINNPTIFKLVPMLAGALFVTCMTCHGELVRLKPPPELLTAFYLAIAVGGALGGVAVALIAPRVFPASYETPLVLTITAAVLLIALWRERDHWSHERLYRGLWLAAASLAIVLSLYAARQLYAGHHKARLLVRNFYGPLRIDEYTQTGHRLRQLNHGTITHGTQSLDSTLRYTPTTYYARDSGIGLTWRILEQTGPIRMGVIGLGTGTLAAYGRAGDSIRFYDINPLVIDIAHHWFTYLSDSPARIEISLGDARLSMEAQSPQKFDILAVDAFSGDAIPVHLLTEEALRTYWRHLQPNGVLAVHVSNHYLNLAPVVALGAKGSGKQVALIESDDDDALGAFSSTWVLVTSRPAFFTNSLLAKQVQSVRIPYGMRPWSDNYSNLWRSLKFDD